MGNPRHSSEGGALQKHNFFLGSIKGRFAQILTRFLRIAKNCELWFALDEKNQNALFKKIKTKIVIERGAQPLIAKKLTETPCGQAVI
jgi:hypothetical protein